jgi:hypothetical protein
VARVELQLVDSTIHKRIPTLCLGYRAEPLEEETP